MNDHLNIITQAEYELLRESYLYEYTKGLIEVKNRLVEGGISESRATHLMENITKLSFANGNIVMIKRNRPRSSVLDYLDLRAIIIGLTVFAIYASFKFLPKILLSLK